MRVDNAALTGESRPKRRTADGTADGHWLDLPNLVFAGTTILSGHGRAVVFATGMQSEFGKIAALTTVVETGLSPLQQEIIAVTRIVALISLVMGVTFSRRFVDRTGYMDQCDLWHRHHRGERAGGVAPDRHACPRYEQSTHGKTQRIDQTPALR